MANRMEIYLLVLFIVKGILDCIEAFLKKFWEIGERRGRLLCGDASGVGDLREEVTRISLMSETGSHPATTYSNQREEHANQSDLGHFIGLWFCFFFLWDLDEALHGSTQR